MEQREIRRRIYPSENCYKDPEVLAVAAGEGRVLVLHDQKTRPRHFVEFVAHTPSPGLLIIPLNRKFAVRERSLVIDEQEIRFGPFRLDPTNNQLWRGKQAVTLQLQRLGSAHLIVLILEDLHWSDHSTIEFLSHLAQRRQPARLLVLGTYRPADLVPGKHNYYKQTHARPHPLTPAAHLPVPAVRLRPCENHLDRAASALLGFNLGVEVGQLGIVMLLWPFLHRLNSSEGRWGGVLTVQAGSAAVLAVGLFWFITRAAGRF